MSTLYEELRQVIDGEVRFDPYSRVPVQHRCQYVPDRADRRRHP